MNARGATVPRSAGFRLMCTYSERSALSSVGGAAGIGGTVIVVGPDVEVAAVAEEELFVEEERALLSAFGGGFGVEGEPKPNDSDIECLRLDLGRAVFGGGGDVGGGGGGGSDGGERDTGDGSAAAGSGKDGSGYCTTRSRKGPQK